jgi:hypothetical protein
MLNENHSFLLDPTLPTRYFEIISNKSNYLKGRELMNYMRSEINCFNLEGAEGSILFLK